LIANETLLAFFSSFEGEFESTFVVVEFVVGEFGVEDAFVIVDVDDGDDGVTCGIDNVEPCVDFASMFSFFDFLGSKKKNGFKMCVCVNV